MSWKRRLRSAVHFLVPSLHGRWQVPLAIVAVLAAAIALYRLKPSRQPVVFDALMADVIALREGGAYLDAVDAAANLLEMEPPLEPEQKRTLHDYLAETLYRGELARTDPNRENVALLIRHHGAAQRLGQTSDTARLLREGRAREWLGGRDEAIRIYRRTLREHPQPEQRRAAQQGLVRLLDAGPDANAERQQLLEALLADEGVSDAYLWWAVQQAVQYALDREHPEQAWQLLLRHHERFLRSDLKGYHTYLRAWVLVHEGRYQEAEPLLEWIGDWQAARTSVDDYLGYLGYLPALCSYLRGRVEFSEQRPQAALAYFKAAQRMQPHGDLLVATTIGSARALARLDRHAAARQLMEDTSERLAGDAARRRGLQRLSHTLVRLGDERAEHADYESALGYLTPAAALVPEQSQAVQVEVYERLGKLHEGAAGQTRNKNQRRKHHAEAGRYFEQAAELTILDELRHATFLWSAAQQYDESGRLPDARRLLLRFVEGRELDPRLPQGMLRLGQAYEAQGRLEEALGWYQAVIEQFPKLVEAARARLLSAGCLRALGEQRWAAAEVLLQGLLEDERIAPDALVFRDALLALCDLLYEQRRYAEVISRLEDFLVLYPDDPERLPSRFLLADAYRMSAYHLRDDPPAEVPVVQARAEGRVRFRRAAELFETFLREVEAAAEPDPAALLYQRLSLFFRADCLFELNETGTLREALAVYREAAARYEAEPAALTAQVQIANIYLRQGKLREAARAVERARWLLRNIPDSVFAEYADGTDPARWDRYLSAVSASGLLRDAFAEMP